MTMSINELKFAGHIGGEIKTGTSQSGKLWVMFNLCHTQKGKDGQPDQSTWVRVKCFGWAAENAKVFQKGDNVIAVGSLQVQNWEKDGKKGTSVDLFAQQVGKIVKVAKAETIQATTVAGFDDIPF